MTLPPSASMQPRTANERLHFSGLTMTARSQPAGGQKTMVKKVLRVVAIRLQLFLFPFLLYLPLILPFHSHSFLHGTVLIAPNGLSITS